MKNVMLNLYQRDYFTFYLLLSVSDFVCYSIFHFPLVFLSVAFVQMIISLTFILRKFKK